MIRIQIMSPDHVKRNRHGKISSMKASFSPPTQQKSSGRILGLIEKIREGERRAVSEN